VTAGAFFVLSYNHGIAIDEGWNDMTAEVKIDDIVVGDGKTAARGALVTAH